ncbi:MAG: hypothetical protein ACXQS4_02580, partial [Methermicoccaceae archaeon]
MKTSKIIEHGLEGHVLKLRAKGLAQREIAKEITETTGIPITQSVVSRYLSNYAPRLQYREEQIQEGLNAGLDKIDQLKQINIQLL